MGENLMHPIEVRFEKNINNLTLVREADTRRHWEYITVTMLGAFFVMGVLFYAWQHYQYIQYGYKIEEAQKQQAHLVQKRNVLRLDRQQWKNPARIASIAKEMGMVPSLPGQIVTLNFESQENLQPQLSAKK